MVLLELETQDNILGISEPGSMEGEEGVKSMFFQYTYLCLHSVSAYHRFGLFSSKKRWN